MIFLFEFASFTIGCFVRIHGSSQHLLTSLLIASAQICSACNFLSPPLSLPFTPSLPPSPSLSLSFSLPLSLHRHLPSFPHAPFSTPQPTPHTHKMSLTPPTPPQKNILLL